MEKMMHQSGDSLDTPRLNFEAWRALLRSNCGGEVEITEPNAFAGWMRPLSVCGLAAVAVKIQWGVAAVGLGCNAHQVKRTHRDVRRDSSDHYLIVYQVAGQSALNQNDQTVQLAADDVALVDATRPATYFTNCRSVQWLTLRLPRRSVLSHFGFELQGGLGRHGTRAGRLLFDLVRDAYKADESASSPADPYMQLAVYDLLGALFAPSETFRVSRHADRMFARIRGVSRTALRIRISALARSQPKRASRCVTSRSSSRHATRPAANSYIRFVWIRPRAYCIAGHHWEQANH